METIKFSKEDIEEITKHRSTLESLIKNRASSSITINFREMVKRMDNKLGYTNTCATCNSALMASVSRIYAEYLKDLKYYEDNKSKEETNNEQKKRGRKAKNNK